MTGLVTVDTGGHWSTFGEVVILALIQAGGLGIMTLATLVTIVVSRRLGLRARLLAQAETKSLRLQDIRRVVRNIVIFSAVSELVAAVILTVRFATAYDEPPGEAAYNGVFHAISAFNNAGFSLNADSLMGYVTDPWVTGTIAAAFIVGGLGFPVAFVIWAELRGDTRVNVGYRRIPDSTQRQAITIALMAVGLVVSSTFTLLVIAPRTLDQVLFEAISAFGTVGLSTGITADLPQSAHVLIVVLMFVGRIGPLTVGSALALRERIRRYELPEERPIVG